MCSFSDTADVKATVQFAPHVMQFGSVYGHECCREAVPQLIQSGN